MSPEQQAAPAWTGLDEQDEFVNMVMYGDPGTGKTTALASLAKLGRILVINAEGGLKKTPLRRLGIPTGPESIQVTTVASFDEAEALLWDLRSRFDQDPNALMGVVVDSITEIEAILLGEGVTAQIAKAQRSGMERDPFDIDIKDWGRNASKMRRFIRGVRALPCHVGFSALAKRDQDEEGVVVYRPMLTPKVSGELVAWCDISVAMQTVILRPREAPMHWGVTRRVGKWSGKDRFGILPVRMPYPSFDRVVGYLAGDLTTKTDPELAGFRAMQKEM